VGIRRVEPKALKLYGCVPKLRAFLDIRAHAKVVA
jgi:hypothetical protein